MNYRDYRDKKVKDAGIRQVCWGTEAVDIRRMIDPRHFIVTYIRAPGVFWISEDSSMYEYELQNIVFLDEQGNAT